MSSRAQDAVDFVNSRLSTGARLKDKKSSIFNQIVNVFLWLPTRGSYMMNFWTTIGKTIYAPSIRGSLDWMVTFHELCHVRQAQREGVVRHSILYLLPQIITVWLIPLLLLFGAGWWSLVGLVFMLPIPAPWRAEKELEGYKMSIAAMELRRPGSGSYAIDAYIEHFTGSNYYFMWPFRDKIVSEMRAHLSQIMTSPSYSFLDGVDRPLYGCLLSFMADNGLLHPDYASQYGFDEPVVSVERN